MATINIKDNRQVIDYLARDFDSFRAALVNLIPAKLPEWTDRSEADFGIVLIELFAYMADILSYYQDRIANECFLSTAQERRSVIQHLKLIGYQMAPASPATAKLSIIVSNDRKDVIEIRNGDQFSSPSTRDRRSVMFEYTGNKPLVVDLSTLVNDSATRSDGSALSGFKEAAGIIAVREGSTIANEVLGVSDGTPNQRYQLAQPNVIRNSLVIVADTTPPTAPWQLRQNLVFSRRAFTPDELAALEQQDRIAPSLAFSRAPDPDFAIEIDENQVTTVIFGDGQYGLIPPVGARMLATYRTGGGAIGNVGAGQITVINKSPQLQVLGAKVVNRDPASGGAEPESIAQAVKFAPTVFASMQRAVTANDYIAQAKLFPGVSKARAEVTNWNFINLFIAPTGSGELPSDILKSDLLAYFENKRMVTAFIRIMDPEYVRIEIQAQIGVLAFFRNEDVQAAAVAAVEAFLDFENVDFGQILYLSKVYEVLEGVAGVDNVFVSRFRRAGDTQDLPPDGRLVLLENQIPVLRPFDLTITPTTVAGGI